MRTPVRTYLYKNHENVWRIHQKAISLHVMSQKTFQTRYISCVLLALTCLLTACSSGGNGSEELDPPAPNPTPNPTPENQEIKLNANVWNMMEGMRASTYDDQAAIQTEGHFTCTVYQANTTTPYINTTTVDWNGDPTNKWLFSDGKHYWPATGNLDFFAYMPKAGSLPLYITTGPTYAVNGTPAPSFVCTDLPVTFNTSSADATQEFIWALTPGQNKASQGATGVTMTFRHPFARVYFKIADASGTAVSINSITISGIKNNGTCTFDGTTSTWVPSGDPTNLVVTCSTPLTTSGTTTIGNFLVLPYSYDGTKTFTVNATWTDWSNVTKDVSADVTVNWQAGYSYTYTFTLSKYALKVDTSKYTEQW